MGNTATLWLVPIACNRQLPKFAEDMFKVEGRNVSHTLAEVPPTNLYREEIQMADLVCIYRIYALLGEAGSMDATPRECSPASV